MAESLIRTLYLDSHEDGYWVFRGERDAVSRTIFKTGTVKINLMEYLAIQVTMLMVSNSKFRKLADEAVKFLIFSGEILGFHFPRFALCKDWRQIAYLEWESFSRTTRLFARNKCLCNVFISNWYFSCSILIILNIKHCAIKNKI